jgi:hypothetical protein
MSYLWGALCTAYEALTFDSVRHVFAALAVSHWIEHQTGWTIKTSPDNTPSPPPTGYPTTSATSSPKSAHRAVHTKLSQLGTPSKPCSTAVTDTHSYGLVNEPEE